MSKKRAAAKKINLGKKRVRALDDETLERAAGAKPNSDVCIPPPCPSHNLCCVNHNQALRRR